MKDKYKNILEQPSEKTYVKWSAALYIRLSREDGDKSESNSITSQREILTDYVSRQEDIEIVDYYIDDGWSGTNFERPAFQRMIDDIEAKKVNCVIVKDLSRFGRNYAKAGEYDEYFAQHRIRFIALNNNIDTFATGINAASQFLSIGMFNLINENYVASASVNIKGSLTNNRKHGKFIGSFPPYGYLKDPNDRHKLIVDETAAAFVRMIFQKYLEGESILGITRTLNKMKVPNPSTYKKSLGWNYHHTSSGNNDGLWCDQTVRRILSNQVYIGNLVQGKNESISYKNQKCRSVPKDQWIIVENTHEAIIDRADFDKVQEMLKKRTKVSQRSGELDLFAGLLKCSDCGRAMSKKTNEHPYGTYVYYRCVTSRKMDKGACTPHSIRADQLENAVLKSIQMIVDVSLDYEKTVSALKKTKKKESKSTGNRMLSKQKNELNRLCRDFAELYDDWKNGDINKDEYRRLKSHLSNEIEMLEKSIEALENTDKVISMPEKNEFIENFKKHKNIDKLTRSILLELVDSILIQENGNITIIFKFSDAYADLAEQLNNQKKQPEIA